MVSEVNKLISNTLVQGRDLFLPGVGTLVVRRNAASRAGSTKMAPPTRTVTFTGEQRGENIVALISSTAGVDSARAEEIYQQWLEQVKKEDVVIIEGVGTIKDRTFTEDKALTALLNPAIAGVVLKPRKNHKPLIIIAVIVAIAAVVVALLLTRKPEPAPVIEEPVVEVVEPVVEEPVVVDKDPDVEDMTPGASYVVWGVFSQKQNAMNYKSMIARRYGDILKPVIYHHKDDTMYLLALDEFKTRNQCVSLINELQEIDGLFDELWIFTNK